MPDPDLEISGGARHPDPYIKGRGWSPTPKNVFRPFGPQFGLKIRGVAPPGPFPGSATGNKEMGWGSNVITMQTLLQGHERYNDILKK